MDIEKIRKAFPVTEHRISIIHGPRPCGTSAASGASGHNGFRRGIVALADMRSRAPDVVVCEKEKGHNEKLKVWLKDYTLGKLWITASGLKFIDGTSIVRARFAKLISMPIRVDSEGPVNRAPWDHVRRRDQWVKPNNASQENIFFMTECTENWFYAHKDALAQYYGQGFLWP